MLKEARIFFLSVVDGIDFKSTVATDIKFFTIHVTIEFSENITMRVLRRRIQRCIALDGLPKINTLGIFQTQSDSEKMLSWRHSLLPVELLSADIAHKDYQNCIYGNQDRRLKEHIKMLLMSRNKRFSISQTQLGWH